MSAMMILVKLLGAHGLHVQWQTMRVLTRNMLLVARVWIASLRDVVGLPVQGSGGFLCSLCSSSAA